jgi:hypothetical protein
MKTAQRGNDVQERIENRAFRSAEAVEHLALGMTQGALMGLVGCAVSLPMVTLLRPDVEWARSIPEGVLIIVAASTVMLGPLLGIAFALMGWLLDCRLRLRTILCSTVFASPLFVVIESCRIRSPDYCVPFFYDGLVALSVPIFVAVITVIKASGRSKGER